MLEVTENCFRLWKIKWNCFMNTGWMIKPTAHRGWPCCKGTDIHDLHIDMVLALRNKDSQWGFVKNSLQSQEVSLGCQSGSSFCFLTLKDFEITILQSSLFIGELEKSMWQWNNCIRATAWKTSPLQRGNMEVTWGISGVFCQNFQLFDKNERFA